MSFRPITRALILAMLAGATALAGCGAQPTAQGQPTPTATATPTPSPTPSPTPLPTVDPTLLAQKCGKDFPTTPAMLVGGLVVTRQTTFGNLAYPARKLPDDLPLKPFALTSTGSIPDTNGSGSIPVNPNLHEGGGGYSIFICNTSTAPHIVQRIDARIEAIAPVSGTPNDAPWCVSDPYSRQNGGKTGGGCGGADFQNEYMHAAFAPSAGVGTTVTATQTGSNYCEYATGCTTNYGPLPVKLQPGQWMTIEVGLDAPTTPGYYTFSFGVGVNGAAPVFAATSPKTLLAPSARQWTGKACQSPAMLAQIPPATNPPSYYLCPAS